MKYKHFGAVYGKRWHNPLLDEYKATIQKDFEIMEPLHSEEDVIETLKRCLENKKSFYENALPYMKEAMEEVEKNLAMKVKY